MSTNDPVRRAKAALEQAKYNERQMHAAVVAGDETITAADLAQAEAAVRLATLRLQSAERSVADEAGKVQEARQAQRRSRAEAAKAKQRDEQRESWQRAIDSGAAARRIEALRATGPSRPRFPAEFDEMLVEAGLLPPITDDGSSAA